jgi:mono/diheme cytochrome c family protein
MMRIVFAGAVLCVLMRAGIPAAAEGAFKPEQAAAGAELYAVNCAPCHGARMLDPGAAFDLRKFPRDQKQRFVDSVTRGKNQMPPWGDFFKLEQLDQLWAYVMAGDR